MLNIGVRPVAFLKEIGEFRTVFSEDLINILENKSLNNSFKLRFDINEFESRIILLAETTVEIDPMDKSIIDKIKPLITYVTDSTDSESFYFPVLNTETLFKIDDLYLTKEDYDLYEAHMNGSPVSLVFSEINNTINTSNRCYTLSKTIFKIVKALYNLSIEQKNTFFKAGIIFKKACLGSPQKGFAKYFESESQEANDAKDLYSDLIIKNPRGASSYRIKGI